jgi:hypothetical protein
MNALKRLWKWLVYGLPFAVLSILTRLVQPLAEDRIISAANGYIDQKRGVVMSPLAKSIKFFAEHPLWFVAFVILAFVGTFLDGRYFALLGLWASFALRRSNALENIDRRWILPIHIIAVAVASLGLFSVGVEINRHRPQTFTPADYANAVKNGMPLPITQQITNNYHNEEKAQNLNPSTSLDTALQHYGLMSEVVKTQLVEEFPLGWDMFTVDLHGFQISDHKTWLPQNEIGNPHRTEFVWTNAGDVALVGDRISVGLPTIVSDQQAIMGNAVSLRREVGVSFEMDLDPGDPGPFALMRGNTFNSDIPGGKIPLAKNPKLSIIIEIQSVNSDGIVMILGLKPYKKSATMPQ